MNLVANFEHGASSSRGKHEGESSFALCDTLSRTRDNSQRQLPTQGLRMKYRAKFGVGST